MIPQSLRARVTAVASLAVAAVLLAAGAVTVLAVRQRLEGDVDDVAVTVLRELTPEVAGAKPTATLVVRGDDDTFAQFVDRQGEVVTATANVEGAPAVVAGLGLHTLKGAPHDEARFRVLARSVPGGTLIVGVTLDDVDQSLGALRRTLLVVSPLMLVALAAVVWLVVGRTLRPVELANRRQRQFVADASHELRSPLTRIRSELEVDLSHPESADPLKTHRLILADAIALQDLVDDLLVLARSDAGGNVSRYETVDLDDLVLEEARRAQLGSMVTIDLSRVSGGQVRGDADQLRRVVRNLVDNALRHARTTLTVELNEERDAVVLVVTDDGPGIPAAEQQRVFERFARLDHARASRTGGTGLGLAITRDIVEGHGGTVSVDPEHDEGARLVVRWPLPPR
ncbi:MAG TPA: HAMP domain-containing sensor histidine kinase [Acidimicrobiales bacterium]|nr:HAMP domain-containing sensor histidine kinase [Acidimicrobiales bacterium]